MNGFTAVLDACTLYAAPLRDLLIRLGRAGMYRARWTKEIQLEWKRNLLKNRRDLQADRLDRTCELMNRAVADCLINGYESLIPTLKLPDENDRHVLAAAIIGRANAIITFNLKDFPEASLHLFNIEAIHPDDFIVAQLDLSPGVVISVLKEQRAALTNPTVNADAFIERFQKVGLPQVFNRLREFSGVI